MQQRCEWAFLCWLLCGELFSLVKHWENCERKHWSIESSKLLFLLMFSSPPQCFSFIKKLIKNRKVKSNVSREKSNASCHRFGLRKYFLVELRAKYQISWKIEFYTEWCVVEFRIRASESNTQKKSFKFFSCRFFRGRKKTHWKKLSNNHYLETKARLDRHKKVDEIKILFDRRFTLDFRRFECVRSHKKFIYSRGQKLIIQIGRVKKSDLW